MKGLKKIRKLNGITMKKLGEKVDVAESTISLYESSKRQPDFNTLQKIASYFKVSTDFLISGFDRVSLSHNIQKVIGNDSYEGFAEKTNIDLDELISLCKGSAIEQPSLETINKIISNNTHNSYALDHVLLSDAGYLDEAFIVKKDEELLHESEKFDNKIKTIESLEFHTPEDAMKFILEQPVLMNFGGYDLDKMTDDEIMALAEDLLLTMKIGIERMKKKQK
jgi:DNA-binding XRE family transcriptional regulator